MVYKERIQQLLEALNGKLDIIEKVSAGSLRLSKEDVTKVINETKQLIERVSNLVENER
jgi:hypothetical protein